MVQARSVLVAALLVRRLVLIHLVQITYKRTRSSYLVGMLPPSEWICSDVIDWYEQTFEKWSHKEEALADELEEFCGADLLDLEMTNDLLKTIKSARRKKQFEKELEKLRRGLHIEDRVKVIPLQQKPWELGDKGQIAVAVFTPENEVPMAHQSENYY